tara:strand:- start:665 stop:853 length:189 start_codon:yes stop_codon:yes gene_type:complete
MAQNQSHQRSRVVMQQALEYWPILSGLITVAAIAVAFRSEINVRIKVLEEKVSTLFDLINKK